MRPTHAIEDFLGSRSKIAVLRVLSGVTVPLNASQIAARTGLSHPAVASALAKFVDSGAVEASSAGRATIYRLQRENVYVSSILLPLLQAEAHVPDVLADSLSSAFDPYALSVILFGSYARGDQDEHSDVDVLLVARDREAKKRLDDALADYGPEFRARFGATLSGVTYELRDAVDLVGSRSGLGESIRWEGLTISGLEPGEWAGYAA